MQFTDELGQTYQLCAKEGRVIDWSGGNHGFATRLRFDAKTDDGQTVTLTLTREDYNWIDYIFRIMN